MPATATAAAAARHRNGNGNGVGVGRLRTEPRQHGVCRIARFRVRAGTERGRWRRLARRHAPAFHPHHSARRFWLPRATASSGASRPWLRSLLPAPGGTGSSVPGRATARCCRAGLAPLLSMGASDIRRGSRASPTLQGAPRHHRSNQCDNPPRSPDKRSASGEQDATCLRAWAGTSPRMRPAALSGLRILEPSPSGEGMRQLCWRRWMAMRAQVATAASRLDGSARPRPARSRAVPWSTATRG